MKKGDSKMKYLKLEKHQEYELEFLSREPETISTSYGQRYNYTVIYQGEEILLRATKKLKETIDFYFGLIGESKLAEKNKNNPDKAKLFVGDWKGYISYKLI